MEEFLASISDGADMLVVHRTRMRDNITSNFSRAISHDGPSDLRVEEEEENSSRATEHRYHRASLRASRCMRSFRETLVTRHMHAAVPEGGETLAAAIIPPGSVHKRSISAMTESFITPRSFCECELRILLTVPMIPPRIPTKP